MMSTTKKWTSRALKFISSETRGMHEAAYLLAAFALGSQVLGMLRDRLLASSFGASHTLDLYYAAFRLPDFLFATIASLLSLYALLPVMSKLEHESEGVMMSFLRQSLVVFFAGMACVSLILFFIAPWLVTIVAPGLAGPSLVLLVRILLLQPILLGASNILAAYTQLRNRFLLYSISPLLYNLGIIFGVVALYPHWGIAGLGWGVIFGACMHVGIQTPFFFGAPARPKLSFKRMWSDLMYVLKLSVPRTLSLSASQFALLALVGIASVLASGSISIFTLAYNLQSVPLTIIGVSYSVAAFPTLARLHAAGAKQEFGRYLETALLHIYFWSIPATVFVVVLRAQLVRVILGAGAFDWNDTRLTAAALALFILALAAQGATLLIARAYYAAGKTRKPLYWGVIDVIVSIASAFGFVALFNANPVFQSILGGILRVSDVPGTIVLTLSLAYALGGISEFIVGLIVFMHDFEISWRSTGTLVLQSAIASLAGGVVTYALLALTGAPGTISTTIGLLLQGLFAGGIGIIATILILALFKNREFLETADALKRRFRDRHAVALEATDVTS